MSTMTKDEALKRLKASKQVKQNLIDKLTKIAVDEYEKRTGVKPTYIETL